MNDAKQDSTSALLNTNSVREALELRSNQIDQMLEAGEHLLLASRVAEQMNTLGRLAPTSVLDQARLYDISSVRNLSESMKAMESSTAELLSQSAATYTGNFGEDSIFTTQEIPDARDFLYQQEKEKRDKEEREKKVADSLVEMYKEQKVLIQLAKQAQENEARASKQATIDKRRSYYITLLSLFLALAAAIPPYIPYFSNDKSPVTDLDKKTSLENTKKENDIVIDSSNGKQETIVNSPTEAQDTVEDKVFE
ncbi:hypothetical protein BWP24_18755 [Vibrio campbellii]|uniref:hypothetical protein n=1 Tax=Vibrio campbellii TaxID=680 RepID=UPI0009718357|nr:hypothetical protein [Vibrio campbellii]APX08239.1 hypothetical protein BWP24_18755 [Vibrio campbellii]ARR09591.1 unknow [Vibrio campbellii]